MSSETSNMTSSTPVRGQLQRSASMTDNLGLVSSVTKPTGHSHVTDSLNDAGINGANWKPHNINTLLTWISISSYMIACLEKAIIDYRSKIRRNVVLGLILSTSSGTLSITQYSSMLTPSVRFIMNMLFTLLNFSIVFSTGYIKVYQIQEQLENFITLKQEWIVFITRIATELQLPVDIRRDALRLIQENKVKYLDLLKAEDEIPEYVKQKIRKKFKESEKNPNFHESLRIGSSALSISDIIFNIGYIEGKNLKNFKKTTQTTASHANGTMDSSSSTPPEDVDLLREAVSRSMRDVYSVAENPEMHNYFMKKVAPPTGDMFKKSTEPSIDESDNADLSSYEDHMISVNDFYNKNYINIRSRQNSFSKNFNYAEVYEDKGDSIENLEEKSVEKIQNWLKKLTRKRSKPEVSITDGPPTRPNSIMFGQTLHDVEAGITASDNSHSIPVSSSASL